MDENEFKGMMGDDDPEAMKQEVMFDMGIGAMILLYNSFRKGGMSRTDAATLVAAIVDKGAQDGED